MLKVFRDNLKRLAWALWLVVAAFILLVFVDFGGAGYQGPTDNRTAATVGNRTISFEEFRRQYQLTERRAQALYGSNYSPELGRQLGLAVQALDALVAQKILLAEAERLALGATPDEIRRAVLEVPGFQNERGRFIGQEQYEAILRANGYTVGEFEREVRDQVMIDKLNDVLQQTTYLSDEEVRRAYRDDVERARIRFIQVPTGTFRDRISIGPQDLATYFAEHRSDFRVPERRSVDYLLVEPRLLRPTLDIDDAELRAYYEANPDQFTREEQVRARHILLTAEDEQGLEQAREQIGELRSRLAAGEDFADLAREYSQDQATASRGGDLGFFNRGRYNPALEEAAFSAAVGELVGPVESDLLSQTGVHLVEVLARQEGGLQDFEEVEPRIRSQLLGERSRQAAETLARELRQRLQNDEELAGAELRTLAEAEEGVSFDSTEAFSREQNVPGIGRGTPFTTAAFELEAGELSEPIQVARGWALLRVREIQESRLPELEEVEEAVREAVVHALEQEAALEALREQAVAMQEGETTLEELARELGVEVKESAEFGHQGNIPELGGAQREIAKQAFRIAEDATGGPILTAGGVVLFRLAERTQWDPAQFETAKEERRAELVGERLNSLLQSLIEERRRELEVHYNQELLESFGVFESAEASG